MEVPQDSSATPVAELIGVRKTYHLDMVEVPVIHGIDLLPLPDGPINTVKWAGRINRSMPWITGTSTKSR